MNADATIIDTMTEAEARADVTAINAAVSDIGNRLLRLREREGWRALGYTSFTKMLEHEFAYTRKHLYQLMKAAPVRERLAEVLPPGYKLSLDAAEAIDKFPDAIQPFIAMTALAHYGGITASRATRIGTVAYQAATSGHVESSAGNTAAFEAALALEDDEADKRQKQYIYDNMETRLVCECDGALVVAQQGDTVTLKLSPLALLALRDRADTGVKMTAKFYEAYQE